MIAQFGFCLSMMREYNIKPITHLPNQVICSSIVWKGGFRPTLLASMKFYSYNFYAPMQYEKKKKKNNPNDDWAYHC